MVLKTISLGCVVLASLMLFFCIIILYYFCFFRRHIVSAHFKEKFYLSLPNLVCRIIGSVSCLGLLSAVVALLLTE